MNSHHNEKKASKLPELETCPITAKEYSEMKQPVIGPGGNVYEKDDIIEWLKKKPTDPMTVTPVTIASYYKANRIIDPLVKAYKACEEASAATEIYDYESQQLQEQIEKLQQQLESQKLIHQQQLEDQKSIHQQQIADLIKIKPSTHEDKKSSNSTSQRPEIQLLSDIRIRIKETEEKYYSFILARSWLSKRFQEKLATALVDRLKMNEKLQSLVDRNAADHMRYQDESLDLTENFEADATEEEANTFFAQSKELIKKWKKVTTKNLSDIKNYSANKRAYFNHSFAKTLLFYEDKAGLEEAKNANHLATFYTQAFSKTGSLRNKNSWVRFFELNEKIKQISHDLEKLKDTELLISETLTQTLRQERSKKPSAPSNKAQPIPSAPPLEASVVNIENKSSENKRESNQINSGRPITESTEIPFIAQLPSVTIQTSQSSSSQTILQPSALPSSTVFASKDKKLTPTEQKEMDDKLVSAMKERDLTQFKNYLAQGANPNIKILSSDGILLPLISGIIIRHKNTWNEGIKALLEYKANINERDDNDATPLHWATYWWLKSTMELLLNHGANPTLVDYQCRTALKEMRTPEKFPDLVALLENAMEAWKKRPLESNRLTTTSEAQPKPSMGQFASSSSHIHPQPSAPPSLTLFAPKDKKLTPMQQLEIDEKLIAAMRQRDLAKFKHCLEQGANPNITISHHNSGQLPLITGIIFTHQNHSWDDGIKALLEYKADVNGRDGLGATPLHWAAYLFRESTIRLLLNNRANPTAIDKFSQTPLVEMTNQSQYLNGDFSHLVSLFENAMETWNKNQGNPLPVYTKK